MTVHEQTVGLGQRASGAGAAGANAGGVTAAALDTSFRPQPSDGPISAKTFTFQLAVRERQAVTR